MAKRSAQKKHGQVLSAHSTPMEFSLPPADEKIEKLHIDIPGSLKWRMKLHMMYLESQGEKSTYTGWVRSLIEGELQREERNRVK